MTQNKKAGIYLNFTSDWFNHACITEYIICLKSTCSTSTMLCGIIGGVKLIYYINDLTFIILNSVVYLFEA